jgi:ribosome-interacting GTPase 1
VLIGTRKYIPCLYVYNKIDAVSLELVDKLARTENTVVISCEMDLNLDYLIERIWESLGLVKVYTKKRGERPDLSDPVCLRKGATIEVCIIILIFPCAWRCKIPRFYDIPQDVCLGIHKSLATNFRYGLVWGRSSKFAPHAQKVSLNHQVQEEDIVSIFTK